MHYLSITVPKKSIKDYVTKPEYDETKQRKSRVSIVDQIPDSVYNSDDSLAFIRERDKDRKAEYVAEFHRDLKHIPIKNVF